MDEKEFQYLYKNNDKYVFMDNVSFEQIEIGNDLITKEQSKYLIENDMVKIQLYENFAVSIILPDNISLKVIEAEGVIKGQTAASSYKPATLERNIKTSVPPFIEVGDEIVISTIDSSYIQKA